MNYIELINQFWRLNEEHSFTTSEVAVYFYLLNTSNKLGWKNPFNQSNGYITNALNISEPTLIRVRNSLKQYGLIDFKSDRGRKHQTVYLLKYLNNVSNTISINWAAGNKTLNNLSNTVSNTNSNTVSDVGSIDSGNSLDNIKHILNEIKRDDEGSPPPSPDPPPPVINEDANPPPPPPGPAPPPSPHLFKDIAQLLEECMRDRMFYEQVCMSLHLEVSQLRGWLEAFNRELRYESVETKIPRDYRKHFSNWIRYKDLKTDPANYSPGPKKNDDKGSASEKGGGQSIAGKQSAARANLADRLCEKLNQS